VSTATMVRMSDVFEDAAQIMEGGSALCVRLAVSHAADRTWPRRHGMNVAARDELLSVFDTDDTQVIYDWYDEQIAAGTEIVNSVALLRQRASELRGAGL